MSSEESKTISLEEIEDAADQITPTDVVDPSAVEDPEVEETHNERVRRLHDELLSTNPDHPAFPHPPKGQYDEGLIKLIEQTIAEEDGRGDLDDMGPDPTEQDTLDSIWGKWSTRTRTVTAKRNDPCPCGSNKKFKKCCLKTMNVYGE